MKNYRKCAVIGVGNVGATVAYTLCGTGMFSEIVLIDTDTERAAGEAADISDGLPFLSPVKVYAGNYDDISDASIVIITAGANQRENETRLDLLSKNIRIFDAVIANLKAVRSDAMYIVVTNPVDILTYYMQLNMDIPAWRIIGSGTVLDTARLKELIGRYLVVDSRNVHSFIIGEHGDSEVAVWSSANVSGINLDDFCRMQKRRFSMDKLNEMFCSVRDGAYSIIRQKGATYYGIAQAVRRIVSSIVRDENSVLTVSTFISGHYGIEDVCLGVPSIVGRSGVKKVLDIPLSESELSQLQSSADVIKNELERCSMTYV